MRIVILITITIIMGLSISFMARANDCTLTDREKIEIGRDLGNKSATMVCFGFGAASGLKKIEFRTDKGFSEVVETACNGSKKVTSSQTSEALMNGRAALELSDSTYPRYSGIDIDVQRRIERNGDQYVFIMDEASPFDPCKPFFYDTVITCL